MADRPYYVKEDKTETELETLLELIPPFFDLVKDIIRPLPQRFSPTDLAPLLQNYRLVLLTQEYQNKINNESSGDTLITRWKDLIKFSIKINESCLGKNEEVVSQVLFRILLEVSDHHKEEYYQTQHTAWSVYNRAGDEDLIRTALQLYHRIYEGSYRTLISYSLFLINLTKGKILSAANIDDYFKEDVQKNLTRIKNSGCLSRDELDLLRFGVNPLVRNAMAHGGTKLSEGMAHLKDKGRKATLGVVDVETLVGSLLITSKGLAAGFSLSFLKQRDQIKKHINWKYDLEKILSVLYSAAKDFKFILDECKLIDGLTIDLALVEMSPDHNRIHPSTTRYGSIVHKIHVELAKPRSQRVRDLIESYSTLFYGYKKLRIQVKNSGRENRGYLEMDVEDLRQSSLDWAQVFNQISND